MSTSSRPAPPLRYDRSPAVPPQARRERLARAAEQVAEQPLGIWIAMAVALALALRAPWLAEPLGNDEGGLLYVAGEWRAGGPFPYGDYFLDRPPLLLLVFLAAAETAGAEAVRAMGALAAVALVVVAALIGHELGGRGAARWAAALAAVMGSSLALGSVFTPAELLAVVPSSASVLLLLLALRDGPRRRALLAGAGALAVCALLVKQSFGDALVAGLVFLAATASSKQRSRSSPLADAAAYIAGAAVPLAALALWAALAEVSVGSIAYALVGFRFDALGELSGSAGDLAGRLGSRLLLPLAASGLLLLAFWAIRGLGRLSGRRVALATLSAWGTAATIAVLLGGSYWQHYLIGVVPFVVVCAALGLAAAPRGPARLTAVALAVLAAGGMLAGPSIREATSTEIGSSEIGSWIAERARPGDTIHVMYSQPNIVEYSELRSPYPYLWSLMVRTFPEAEPRLRSLLSSPARPTWLVEWEDPGAYGLDRSGATARIVEDRYREVAPVCGHSVLLDERFTRPVRGAGAPDCEQAALIPALP